MKPPLLPGLVVLASLFFLQLPGLRAQTDDTQSPLWARIDLGSNRIVKLRNSHAAFERVGLDPDQTIEITLQYPVEMAGQAIVAEPLDGGRVTVSGKGLVINAEGRASFQFKARDVTGEARISLYAGETLQTLRFWVRDKEHPERNPKVARGS